MSEPVQLFQRASGETVLGCTVNLQRHVYAPLAKPTVIGLGLWCKDCKQQHLYRWLSLLFCMERFVTPEVFRQVLGEALAAMPKTVSWREGE